ncbi:leucine-rich repeat domain-containing protein [Blastopirellula retiformator]|uniref:Leucine Rich repeats (2 copies) n=1 Tax=Blastopirellula retiformator TaxID=2527970 RepID=A0A5C5VKZ7_9BACT|nr:hypothetical protein [Blastopirellula retiformator]TWT38657.1 Leucine Rich repeats (2 copies) [Blastopirellula retiformator]
MKTEEPSTSTTAPPPRRRLRFSLRTLLIVTPILAALFAWIGSEKLRHDRDQAAAEHLRTRFDTTWNSVNGRWNHSPPKWSELVRGRLYLPQSGLSLQAPVYGQSIQLDDQEWQALDNLLDLKVLKLFHYQGSENQATFSRLRSVEQLHIGGGKLTPSELRQINTLANLKELEFSDYQSPTDKAFAILDKESLNRDDPASDIRLPLEEFHVSLQSWPRLEELNLMSFELSDRSLEAIAEIDVLCDVSLQQCDFDPRSLDRFQQMPNLTRLTIFPVLGRRIDGERIPSPNVDETNLTHWGRHPRLECLSLGMVDLDSFGGQDGNLSGRWPVLQILTLIGVDLSATAIEEIAAIPNLKYLSLSRCDVPPRSLDALAQIKTLTNLSLEESGVDEALMQKLASLSNLEVLQLEGAEITDQAMLHIAQIDQIKHLSLRETNVGDAGIALLENHPHLESVRISGGPATKRSLASLATIKNISLMKSNLATADGADAIRIPLARLQDSGGDVQAELKSLRITPAKPVQP